MTGNMSLNAPRDAGVEASHSIGRFDFEAGGFLEQLKIGFVTYGALNAARDNAIVVLPGTANTRHSADGYIGPGKAFDTDAYFVIALDAIGAGTSSKPSDGLRGRFPAYNIRDMVRAGFALVQQVFGISRVRAVAGASMGAFQALEWSILYPEATAASILMVPAARAGHVFRSTVATARRVLTMDPLWKDGQYDVPPVEGLRMAGRVYYPWTVTDAWIEQLSPEQLEAETQQTVERAAQWDAWDFLKRYEASASHDISQPFAGDFAKALDRVQASTLVLPSATDRLLPVASARLVARGIRHACYAEIPSTQGHLGWRAVQGSPATTFINDQIARFLGTTG
ncbi:alpha/beta fold hydrolase [Hydrogenophaga sp. BPS33]|uniref:alpha/beta fold hydrolase n=1 Tax=Hydrogenophaga sp. BPS33 TaxID=2651974 RepID=UPI00131FA4F6|nr:alpha/beta fold hydrolase [Hydrogenophaga sp. BPS33]QHE85338.1 alpha/beta fold hydrolase [Hydrogenophaga sp. BPS33]